MSSDKGFDLSVLGKAKQQLDEDKKKWRHNYTLGEDIGSRSKDFKVAIMGNYGTGKTTMAAEFVRLRPLKTALWLNTEPLENLQEILDDYPDVRDRTKVVPTKENLETIRIIGQQYDAEGIVGGHERAMAEFFLDYVKWLFDRSYDELENYVIVVDTASQVAKQLRMATYDLIKKGDIDQKKSRFAYGEPKRKFNILAGRLLRLPTDVLLLARVQLEGVFDEQEKTFEYTGVELAEWGSEIKDTSLWFDINMVIHLFKKEVYAEDKNGKNYKDSTGDWAKQVIRWAKITKHKVKQSVVPIFFNPNPGDIIKWIERKHQETIQAT